MERTTLHSTLLRGSYISLPLLGVFALILYFIGKTIYNIYFHPLAKFPGPKRAVISDVFYVRTILSGRSPFIMAELHKKYGDVVRWAPNELSFCDAAAWNDIYGTRKSGNVYVKDPQFYPTDNAMRAKHIVNTSDPAEHREIRKMMSNAFSARSLLEQEHIVLQYAEMLMTAIAEESQKGLINLTDMYNWTTFDVLGELAFGESFKSLANRKTDSWITIILQSIKYNAYDVAFYRYPPLGPWLQPYLMPTELKSGGEAHVRHSKAKILARMKKGSERKDFTSYIFAKRDELKITDWQMAAHSNALIVAGSETSATLLSGLTYYLCRTPEVYQKLKEEIRGRFKTSEEINSISATLPYLTAVIKETFRIYPPIPIGMPRVTPPGGDTVAGRVVPGGTKVSVHMWSTSHNPKYFKDPEVFRPERWIDPKCTDNLAASNPFLVGPRACMGQNMAWMELRILIAKMIFRFDFELVDANLDWNRDGTCFVLWQKPALWTKAMDVLAK